MAFSFLFAVFQRDGRMRDSGNEVGISSVIGGAQAGFVSFALAKTRGTLSTLGGIIFPVHSLF